MFPAKPMMLALSVRWPAGAADRYCPSESFYPDDTELSDRADGQKADANVQQSSPKLLQIHSVQQQHEKTTAKPMSFFSS
jgi:hypothetical protein